MIYLGIVIILIGCFLVISGAIGCLKFPDFFTRLHAAGVADSGGVTLIVIGLVIQNGLTLFSTKLVLLLLFLLISSPTSCHALLKAAICGGLTPQAQVEEINIEQSSK